MPPEEQSCTVPRENQLSGLRSSDSRNPPPSSPVLSPGTAWEKEHETFHLQHTLHVEKGALTSAGPAVAAQKPHAKGERGVQTPILAPRCLSFPFCKAGCPTQVPSFSPLTQNHQHLKLEPQWFMNSPLQRSTATGISCIEKIKGTIKPRNSKILH